jgi:hypothetical protein
MITAQHRDAFGREGYLALESALQKADLLEVRDLLDPLFTNFERLPTGHALNLCSGDAHGNQVNEINRPIAVEPRLRRTNVFRRCQAIARQMLGAPTYYRFDHAIYKPGGKSAPTHWHQDQAFVGMPRPLNSIHFWVPLQDATRENGCMWFVPGSHRSGHLHHGVVTGCTHALHTVEVNPTDAVCCPIKAGGLTMHGPLTLHMTGANETAHMRRAWIIHFAKWGRLGYVTPGNVSALVRRVASS